MFGQIDAAILCCELLVAQTSPPEWEVKGNVIRSSANPKVRIQLPATAHYVGADRWVLYGMADCELHAFVEADNRQRVLGLYGVQFEGYLPSRPELQHTYASPKHANLGGMDFYVDIWARKTSATTRAGSDIDHV